MIILFVFGAMQGAIGWIMVKSGLVPEKYFVGHVELTTHFVAALGLLCYTLWFALSLLIRPQQQVTAPHLKKLLVGILIVFFIQLIYGGFMAGMKAAVTASTWPDINGKFIPGNINELQPAVKNFVYNPIAVQFIHRGIAYILLILSIVWLVRSKAVDNSRLFSRLTNGFSFLIFLQVVLGILTVLNATYANRLVWFGVLHQFVAMVLLMVLTGLLFLVRKKPVM